MILGRHKRSQHQVPSVLALKMGDNRQSQIGDKAIFAAFGFRKIF